MRINRLFRKINRLFRKIKRLLSKIKKLLRKFWRLLRLRDSERGLKFQLTQIREAQQTMALVTLVTVTW